MPNKFQFVPGVYRVVTLRLNIRGTPDSTNPGNLIGTGVQLTQGKEFPVYHIHVTDQGWVWGIVTPDGSQQAHYVCLWDLNRTYADFVSPFANTGVLVDESQRRKVIQEVIKLLESLL